jgi:predicted nucleotidyltransferase component of viral defense system
MITPTKETAYHKAMMIRILSVFFDDRIIAHAFAFKGGSCASMAGFLEQFSVDLDFDLLEKKKKKTIEERMIKILINLNFAIKKQSKKELFFVVKYQSIYPRNSLKISIVDKIPKSNQYQPLFLPDLNRFIPCQTVETMFTNKLVAITDRYHQYHQVAARDLYDIHHFFSKGFDFSKEVIEERTKMDWQKYFKILIEFIPKKFNQKIIDEDLNFLLLPEKFRTVRKTLITETLIFLNSCLK